MESRAHSDEIVTYTVYGSKRCCLAVSSDKLRVTSPLPTWHIIGFTYDRKFPESCDYIRTKVNSAALSYEVLRPLYILTAVRYGLLNLQWKLNECIFIQCQNVAVFRSSTKAFWDQSPGAGGYFRNFGWGCAAGTLEPPSYTKASSAEFFYPKLEQSPQHHLPPPPPPPLILA